MFELVTAILSGLFAIVSATMSLRRSLGSDAYADSRSWHARTPLSVRATIAVVALGWATGCLSYKLRPFCEIANIHLEALATIVLLSATTIWLAWRTRVTDRKNSTFQLRLVALWTSFVSGWSAMHGNLWEDLVVVALGWWLGCSVVGAAIVFFPKRASQSSALPDDLAEGDSAANSKSFGTQNKKEATSQLHDSAVVFEEMEAKYSLTH
jgi:hypothetical protein